MTDEPKDETLSVQIANQIINVANARLQDGVGADDIAVGLRHAAANFSAYACTSSHSNAGDPNELVEEFVRFLEYYLSRHKGDEPPASGLLKLIDQAKNEF